MIGLYSVFILVYLEFGRLGRQWEAYLKKFLYLLYNLSVIGILFYQFKSGEKIDDYDILAFFFTHIYFSKRITDPTNHIKSNTILICSLIGLLYFHINIVSLLLIKICLFSWILFENINQRKQMNRNLCLLFLIWFSFYLYYTVPVFDKWITVFKVNYSTIQSHWFLNFTSILIFINILYSQKKNLINQSNLYLTFAAVTFCKIQPSILINNYLYIVIYGLLAMSLFQYFNKDKIKFFGIYFFMFIIYFVHTSIVVPMIFLFMINLFIDQKSYKKIKQKRSDRRDKLYNLFFNSYLLFFMYFIAGIYLELVPNTDLIILTSIFILFSFVMKDYIKNKDQYITDLANNVFVKFSHLVTSAFLIVLAL